MWGGVVLVVSALRVYGPRLSGQRRSGVGVGSSSTRLCPIQLRLSVAAHDVGEQLAVVIKLAGEYPLPSPKHLYGWLVCREVEVASCERIWHAWQWIDCLCQ